MGRTVTRIFAAGRSFAGRSHEKKAIPCQDAVRTYSRPGVYAMAVADGAGSALCAEEGADIAGRACSRFVSLKFSELMELSDRDAAARILEAALKAIGTRSRSAGQPISAYASTLLFVAVSRDQYLAGHLGDGLLARIASRGAEVLSAPDRGEFANVTFFLTSSDALNHFRIYRGTLDADDHGFAMMTDGSCSSLFSASRGMVAGAVGKFVDWHRENPSGVVKNAIWRAMKKRVVPQTDDDCSIGIISRVTLDIDELVSRGLRFIESYLGAREEGEIARRLETLRTGVPFGTEPTDAGATVDSRAGEYFDRNLFSVK
jgi:hypothetical protein